MEQKNKQETLTKQGQEISDEGQRKIELKPFDRESFDEAKKMILEHTAVKATVNLRIFLEENVAELLNWGVKNSLIFEVLPKQFDIGSRNSFNTIWKEVRENHKKALRVQRAEERARVKAQKEIASENDGGNSSLELENQNEQVPSENLMQYELKYAPADSDISDCYNAILKVKVPGKSDKNKNFADVREIREQFPSWTQELFKAAMRKLIIHSAVYRKSRYFLLFTDTAPHPDRIGESSVHNYIAYRVPRSIQC